MCKNRNYAREYKQNCAFNIGDVNFARIIATRVYDTSLKNFFREFARLIFFDYAISLNQSALNIFMVYSYRGKGRSDFDGIVGKFYEFFDNGCGTLDCLYKVGLKYLPEKFFNFIKYSIKFTAIKISKPLFAACLIAQFKHYPRIILKKVNFANFNLIVTFCDAHGIENLITQLANKYCKTATLQHGQYRVLKPENENADVESYENFISDYLLAWGKVTQKEFVKAGIEESKVIPVGAIKPFSNNERLERHEWHNVFGVVLDGEVYRENNIRMIKLANELSKIRNLKYLIRFHPKNNPNTYLVHCKKSYLLDVLNRIENKSYAEKVDFSLVHMTGVFVELLSVNSPMFLFNDEYLENIFKIDKSCFTNLEELIKLYDDFKIDADCFLNRQYLQYRDFNQEGNIKKNYLTAIKYILEGTKK